LPARAKSVLPAAAVAADVVNTVAVAAAADAVTDTNSPVN
jgi:hypothetical protein